MSSHPLTTICSILFAFTGIFLMIIILLQRGRGGGLAGAFGAAGGQSAFGTKAGDVFTKITIGVAIVWVALAAVTGYAMTYERSNLFESDAKDDSGEVEPLNKKAPAKPPGEAGNTKPAEGQKSSGPAGSAPKTGEESKPSSTSSPDTSPSQSGKAGGSSPAGSKAAAPDTSPEKKTPSTK